MKKAITFLTVILVFALTATAQKKEELKLATMPQNQLRAVQKAGSDTLELTEAVKFVKISNKVISTELLGKALIIMDAPTIESLLNDINEYPAKFANPFSVFFLKKFGITTTPPSDTKK